MLKPLVDAMGGWKPRDGASGPQDAVTLLAAGWPDIVGADVARNSTPVRLDDGTLSITTRSSAWSQQLSLLSERIVVAVNARIPKTPVRQLRFKVGTVRAPAERAGRPSPSRNPVAGNGPDSHDAGSTDAPPAATAREAVERFRTTVTQRRRANLAAGWKECEGCGALLAPAGAAWCVTCANARAEGRAAAVARLLFEAPWLGFAGTSALIEGLSNREYESIRTRLLSRWWETLVRARYAKKLSRDGRERLVASSYVLLKSKLPPEEIAPATIRNVLGDEIHDLIYGTEHTTKANVE
jgi:hypothetical protein